MIKVLVAMSGGVDSSVACYLLKEKGYRCIGATIKTWPKQDCRETGEKICCSLDAVYSAKNAAAKLGIPHYVFDFNQKFARIIKDYFTSEYKKGRTPNPCVYCNSDIKFGLLLKKAEELACDFMATGHYARIASGKNFRLKKGKDIEKDQSYFLFNLNQSQLKYSLLPLGGMLKEDVRKIAKGLGMKSYARKSSQDICFDSREKNSSRGKIFFSDGKFLGYHKGISHYTVGQRKGLGVAYSEPLYVTKIDAFKNIVYVGVKSDTFKKSLILERLNWIRGTAPKTPFRAGAKIRYGAKEAPALIRPIKEKVRVDFDKPVSSPTPGQAVVFYDKDVVLGGGWIKEIIS